MQLVKKDANIKRFIDISSKFFIQTGGVVKNIYCTKRKNIEIIDVSDNDVIDVCCLDIEFDNNNMFGKSTYIDAYKGYRRMRSDWWNYLGKFRLQ